MRNGTRKLLVLNMDKLNHVTLIVEWEHLFSRKLVALFLALYNSNLSIGIINGTLNRGKLPSEHRNIKMLMF
jgi:hypothetical protein